MHRMRSNSAADFDHLDNSFHQSNDDASMHLHICAFAKCTQPYCTMHSTARHTHALFAKASDK